MLTGDERDTTLITIGAVQALHRAGTSLYEQAGVALRAYGARRAEGNEIEAERWMLVIVTLVDLLDKLRLQLRESHISEASERFARAVDSYLEDLTAVVRASSEGRADDFDAAGASRNESSTMVDTTFGELVGRLSSRKLD